IPVMDEVYGNAASRQHEFGWRAEAVVEQARSRVAALVGALPEEIIFTSGATESVNIALQGVARASAGAGKRIVTARTEHRAVLDACARLETEGFEIVRLPVDRYGLVDPDDVRRALAPGTILVSIMAANNEIGTLAPLGAIGALCRGAGVLFHTDATQAAGNVPIDMHAMQIDLLSLSAHKMYGPKGVGALAVRARRPAIRIVPLFEGGGHERGIRPGTLNVPGIAGFGAAAGISAAMMGEESARLSALRDRLVSGLEGKIGGLRLNGHPELRLAHNANLLFPGVNADRLMMAMKDIAVSTGSACSTSSPEPSHVLAAIGLSRQESLSSLRFGLGRFTTEEEIEYAVGRVSEAVRTITRGAPQAEPVH
ncbi:MAG TPA: aminotransferase class V-fold PLP-dependent enzyme, partial [Bacteroidota bacterium]|nr:aminotransferase class V-fold PLP-dependent enzyme [Bacteroidota bacterium]